MTQGEQEYSIEQCIYILKNSWFKQQLESIKREIAAAEEQKQNEAVNSLLKTLIDLQREWNNYQQHDPNGRGDNGDRRK